MTSPLIFFALFTTYFMGRYKTMKYYDKDKEYDKYYKRIEAMYYKGLSIDEIVNNIRGMNRIDIINIIQLVEARKNLRRA